MVFFFLNCIHLELHASKASEDDKKASKKREKTVIIGDLNPLTQALLDIDKLPVVKPNKKRSETGHCRNDLSFKYISQTKLTFASYKIQHLLKLYFCVRKKTKKQNKSASSERKRLNAQLVNLFKIIV